MAESRSVVSRIRRGSRAVVDRVTAAGKAVGERVMLRSYDLMRDSTAWDIELPDEPPGTLEGLRGHKYVVVVSYRRDGTPVPSPLWFGLRDGRAYIRTGDDSWKVKRMRRNPSVTVAPSTMRGRPVGPWIPATVRILPREEHPMAAATRISAYGLGRWLYDRTVARMYGAETFLEVTAVASITRPEQPGPSSEAAG